MFLRTIQVEEYERGLRYRDGRFVDLVGAGRYREWDLPFLNVRVVKVDLRQRLLAISGQEVMTQDNVTLRVNLIGRFQVSDPIKAVQGVVDYAGQIYTDLQLALREQVSAWTLDALLTSKGALATALVEVARPKAVTYGVDLLEAGVKDIVLPGDMKVILNQVLTARKTAEAALIQRREEVAATRSLANTAALLEKNPTLLRLKELEVLERIMQGRGNTVVFGLPTQALDVLHRLPQGTAQNGAAP